MRRVLGWTAAMMLVLGTTACGGEDDGPAEATDPAQMTASEAAAVPCPDPVPAKELTGSGTLPDAPLAIRLCTGPAPGAGIEAPEKALTTGTQQLVDLVNGYPKAPKTQPCTMDLGPSYTLLFTYADGSSVPVVGELFGCRPVYVGSVKRTAQESGGGGAAEETQQQFRTLLRQQG